MRIRTALLFNAGVLFLLSSRPAYAIEPLTVTIIVGGVCLVVGIIGSFVASWWFASNPPPVPICKDLGFVRSEKVGDDRMCVYVHENHEYPVMLSAIKKQHPDIQGCPESIHPKA